MEGQPVSGSIWREGQGEEGEVDRNVRVGASIGMGYALDWAGCDILVVNIFEIKMMRVGSRV